MGGRLGFVSSAFTLEEWKELLDSLLDGMM